MLDNGPMTAPAHRDPPPWRRLAACALGLALAAFAASSAAAATPAKPCRYIRLGSMPATWVHSHLEVPGTIEHVPETMVLDTGATDTVIPERMAQALSLERVPDWVGRSYGAGGKASTWFAKIHSIQVGDVQGHDVHLTVASTELSGVLVGADFLFQHDLELTGGLATSYAPLDCDDAPLAYWAADVPWVDIEPSDGDDRRVVVQVRIDGQPIRALVDTGASFTVLDVAAARRLHLDDALRGAPATDVPGIGAKRLRLWSVPIAEFAIGGEQVVHTRLMAGDLWGHERADRGILSGWWNLRHAPELVLGADFLQAHHLLFAMKQRRLYFSYLGGDLFNTRTESGAAEPAAPQASGGAGG